MQSPQRSREMRRVLAMRASKSIRQHRRLLSGCRSALQSQAAPGCVKCANALQSRSFNFSQILKILRNLSALRLCGLPQSSRALRPRSEAGSHPARALSLRSPIWGPSPSPVFAYSRLSYPTPVPWGIGTCPDQLRVSLSTSALLRFRNHRVSPSLVSARAPPRVTLRWLRGSHFRSCLLRVVAKPPLITLLATPTRPRAVSGDRDSKASPLQSAIFISSRITHGFQPIRQLLDNHDFRTESSSDPIRRLSYTARPCFQSSRMRQASPCTPVISL